jgi:hypothetical protein
VARGIVRGDRFPGVVLAGKKKETPADKSALNQKEQLRGVDGMLGYFAPLFGGLTTTTLSISVSANPGGVLFIGQHIDFVENNSLLR